MLNNNEYNVIAAGCDEVGRGCLAGPVVTAAVILPNDYNHVPLKDSKQLTAKQRIILDKIIREEAIDWAIGFATPEEFDKINILKASFLAMHRAIDKLTVTPDTLLIDGKHFKAYPGINHQCIVKGDQKVSCIAAASVIAKVYRDKYMQELAIEVTGYRWEVNMGYPTLSHRKAIHELGITSHHRKTFHHVAEKINPTLWTY
ncbi:MAG: ribonuclease HII [Candidatus Amoebophilus sp. 36-38]|nr:MAG: ribonuclease HII [Candidatus Amoebophilus sp. 36-38]